MLFNQFGNPIPGGGGGAPAPEEPSGSPYAWLDISQEVGYSNGENVDPILDWSPTSRTLWNGTVAFQSSIQNGLNGLRNTGAQFKVAYATNYPIVSQPNTIFSVGKLTAPSTTHVLFGSDNGYASEVGTNGTYWYMSAGTQLLSAVAEDEDWHVFTALFNGASSTLRLDGVQIAAGDAGSNTMRGRVMGANGFGTSNWKGDYGEMIIYDGNEDPSDNEAYLAAKWGITLP